MNGIAFILAYYDAQGRPTLMYSRNILFMGSFSREYSDVPHLERPTIKQNLGYIHVRATDIALSRSLLSYPSGSVPSLTLPGLQIREDH